jgi:hypothetical protein
MTKEQLKARTKSFALRVMNMIDYLPNNVKGRVSPTKQCEALH